MLGLPVCGLHATLRRQTLRGASALSGSIADAAGSRITSWRDLPVPRSNKTAIPRSGYQAGRRTRATRGADRYGDNDPSVPAANWYPLIGRTPRGRIVVLPQSGHGPRHQYPHLAADYVAAFLRDRW